MKLLALGDVVGAYGTRETAALLPRLRRETGADFVVVNAENAAPGNGTDPASAELLLASGADVLTGGNHTLRRYDFFDMLNEHDCVLRPLNYPPAAPGKGFTILRGPEGLRILVLSLCGQVFMGPADNPFTAAERLLAEQHGATTSPSPISTPRRRARSWPSRTGLTARFKSCSAPTRTSRPPTSSFWTRAAATSPIWGCAATRRRARREERVRRQRLHDEGAYALRGVGGEFRRLRRAVHARHPHRCVTDVKRIRTCKNGTVMV